MDGEPISTRKWLGWESLPPKKDRNLFGYVKSSYVSGRIQLEGVSHFLLYVDDKINILTRSTHDEDSPCHLGWSTSLAPGSDTGKWRIFLLIAQTLGRGKKDENRGENEGKPTSLFTTFKAIWQKERHHRTKRSFRQSLFLGKSTGRIHPFM